MLANSELNFCKLTKEHDNLISFTAITIHCCYISACASVGVHVRLMIIQKQNKNIQVWYDDIEGEWAQLWWFAC